MRENPAKYKGENLPVERVVWEEANEYCKKVGKLLPTESRMGTISEGK
jgi:formylglycine-generating enzyme required for sulfatase activity